MNEILNIAQLSLDDIPHAQCDITTVGAIDINNPHDCSAGEEPLVPDRDDLNQRFAQIEDKLNELLGVANLQCKF